MTSFETFHMIDGPLDGLTIELAHEDVFHPSTDRMTIFGADAKPVGVYRFVRVVNQCVGRWECDARCAESWIVGHLQGTHGRSFKRAPYVVTHSLVVTIEVEDE